MAWRLVPWLAQSALLVVDFVWLHEARTCGFCFISQHIAPFAIAGQLVLGGVWLVSSVRRLGQR